MNNPWRGLFITVTLIMVLIAMSFVTQLHSKGADEERIKSFNFNSAIPDSSIQITSIPDGAVIPRNYQYPLVEWSAKPGRVDDWLIRCETTRQAFMAVSRTKKWRPSAGQLTPLLRDSTLCITIYARNGNKTYVGQSVHVTISPDSLSDDIVYRLVEPLFNAGQTSSVQVFRWDNPYPDSIFLIPGTCVGCHVYAVDVSLLNVRKGKDRRLVTANGDGCDQQVIGEFTFITISPDNQYAAVVANTRGKIDIKKQSFDPFDLPYETGDIFIYNLKQKGLRPLPGASELDFVEDMPYFSSDGKTLYFTRYRFDANGIGCMDLYKVPFNQGNGGSPIPVVQASGKGYHYFSRYSPDGKWLSFCRGDARQGVFAKSTSDIYLLSVDEKRLIKLACDKDGVMDSWHWWSSDSQWLLFSSNREDNQMTALYLTHIDGQGGASPALKLLGFDSLKVNLPQFTIPGRVPNGQTLTAFIDSTYQ